VDLGSGDIFVAKNQGSGSLGNWQEAQENVAPRKIASVFKERKKGQK